MRICGAPTASRWRGSNSARAVERACSRATHSSADKRLAAVERVDEDLAPPGRAPHEEVAGEPDPLHRQPDPRGDLDVEDRQRDRDPEPAVDHLVQERVPGVVVVLLVAAIARLVEEHGAELPETLRRRAVRRQPGGDRGGELVQHGDVPAGVEARVLLLGHRQGRLGERDRGSRDERGEARARRALDQVHRASRPRPRLLSEEEYGAGRAALTTRRTAHRIRAPTRHSPVAQLAEQVTVNHRVASSSLAWGAFGDGPLA